MTENGQTQGARFALERIYIKDISYEAPAVPRVFFEQASPQLDVQLGISHTAFSAQDGLFEVVLSVTASAKQPERTLFLVEVHQAGIFRVSGVSGDALSRTLEISCPSILLPFVREAVNDLVGKGGFPQLLINPINFEALYDQKQATLKEQKDQVKQ
ncbi:preprotein translocase subunit SecB [Sulfurifustis variabilis]|uniref:Protein-export protein SecB n=1 Tax=Sulfurifustis variabilis TaxID=1675686 RepID=A0A1B4V3D6_9GAMM|nr:protein-export chaperone SecB [Sulfurifustis variabilis]BAU47002.1 preprotein translocase subunit SecB [Sulfurifustis variabilis]